MTISDLCDKLKQVDEVSLLELLNIRSDDIVDRFLDVIEEKADMLEGELFDE